MVSYLILMKLNMSYGAINFDQVQQELSSRTSLQKEASPFEEVHLHDQQFGYPSLIHRLFS